jgi:hypothetical protein
MNLLFKLKEFRKMVAEICRIFLWVCGSISAIIFMFYSIVMIIKA